MLLLIYVSAVFQGPYHSLRPTPLELVYHHYSCPYSHNMHPPNDKITTGFRIFTEWLSHSAKTLPSATQDICHTTSKVMANSCLSSTLYQVLSKTFAECWKGSRKKKHRGRPTGGDAECHDRKHLAKPTQFAECLTGTYNSLSSVFFMALGRHSFCRV